MQLAHDNKNHNRFVFKFDRKVIPRIEKIDKGMILTEINDDPKYNFKNFEFVRCGEKVHVLGTGAFGEVLLAINKIDSQLYAIKQIDLSKTKSSATARSLVMREINIHRRLSHENIVKLYSSYEEGNKIYLILEYVNKGNLYHLINSNKGLSEEKAFKYFIQVVYAVYFLHENKLIHRDIKPENILIGDKDEAKLCDFGWCIESDPSSRSSFCGTLEYIAPEIYNRKQYSYSVDAWSLGVLLYELVHGVSPFKTTSKVDQQKKIYSNIAENKIKIDGRVSSDCADLIKRLLQFDKNKRMKVREIFAHKWIVDNGNKFSQETKEFVVLKTYSSHESVLGNYRNNYQVTGVEVQVKQHYSDKIQTIIEVTEEKKKLPSEKFLQMISTDINEKENLSKLNHNVIQDSSLFNNVLKKIKRNKTSKYKQDEKTLSMEIEASPTKNKDETIQESTNFNNLSTISVQDSTSYLMQTNEKKLNESSILTDLNYISTICHDSTKKTNGLFNLGNNPSYIRETKHPPNISFSSSKSNIASLEILEKASRERSKMTPTPKSKRNEMWSMIGNYISPFKCEDRVNNLNIF